MQISFIATSNELSVAWAQEIAFSDDAHVFFEGWVSSPADVPVPAA
jgi:hypothetical protein